MQRSHEEVGTYISDIFERSVFTESVDFVFDLGLAVVLKEPPKN